MDTKAIFKHNAAIESRQIMKTSIAAFFFYKHMKFWNQASLCLAIYGLKAHILLNFQSAGLPV